MPRLVAPVIAFLVLAIASLPTVAQDATPAALPVTPDPSECTTAAPSIDELLALAGATPGAGERRGSEGAVPTPFELPEGEPADDATVAAITATMREVVACFNTGNFLTFLNFLTDDMIQEVILEPISEEEAGSFQATPPPLAPELYASLLAVREVRMLPDGRVGALVETTFPDEEPGIQVDFFSFEEQEGRWLIDGIVQDLEGQFPPISATPTA